MTKNKSQTLSTNVSTTCAGQLSKAQEGKSVTSVHQNREETKEGPTVTVTFESLHQMRTLGKQEWKAYIKGTRKERKSINCAKSREESN